MKIEKVSIGKIKKNPTNPRVVKDKKFEKLVKSIRDFPKMLEIRPIVVNDDMMILGGNMRYEACKKAGLTEIFIIKASEFSEAEQKEFIIKDNINTGTWDFDDISTNWDLWDLKEWWFDLFDFEASWTPWNYANPEEEWNNHLDFHQDDTLWKYQIKVHIFNEEDLKQFAELMQQKITEKTKSIYFPPLDTEKPWNFRYVKE